MAKRGTEEWRNKIRERLKGKSKSDEHKKHLSESHKGQVSWNTGKKVGPHPNYHKVDTGQKIKETRIRNGTYIAWNKGLTGVQEAWNKIPVGTELIRDDRNIIVTEEGWKLKSRLVIEQKLGRKLVSSEIVHHKDRNSLNDDPDNLEGPITRSEHASIHARGIS